MKKRNYLIETILLLSLCALLFFGINVYFQLGEFVSFIIATIITLIFEETVRRNYSLKEEIDQPLKEKAKRNNPHLPLLPLLKKPC